MTHERTHEHDHMMNEGSDHFSFEQNNARAILAWAISLFVALGAIGTLVAGPHP